MRQMMSKGMDRRKALAEEVRKFKKLDAADKQSEIDKMMGNVWLEVEKLTRTAVGPVDDLQRFQTHVDAAERAVEKLEAGMKKEMLAQVAALAKGWERVSAATSCWVEVYDKDPYDKTAVRLRCSYIREADNMLERLEALLPLEEWQAVLCCSPGQYQSSTNIVGYYDIQKTRIEVENILEARNELVFHNDSEAGKKQLVIVRR
jgi:hypothetical protein